MEETSRTRACFVQQALHYELQGCMGEVIKFDVCSCRQLDVIKR